MSATDNSRQVVVLLHGILRSNRSMRKLAKILHQQGYRVLNLNYPSTRHSLEALSDFLHGELKKQLTGEYATVHFIGFSMGSLLIRAYLHKYRPERLGRVIMLAPPNKGSQIADYFREWRLFKFLYGPAGAQLITNQETLEFAAYTLPCEVGVLAGNHTRELIFSRFLPKPNDGKVTVENTKIDGMKDHRVLRASHEFFPDNKDVIRHTIHFLKEGRFG